MTLFRKRRMVLSDQSLDHAISTIHKYISEWLAMEVKLADLKETTDVTLDDAVRHVSRFSFHAVALMPLSDIFNRTLAPEVLLLFDSNKTNTYRGRMRFNNMYAHLMMTMSPLAVEQLKQQFRAVCLELTTDITEQDVVALLETHPTIWLLPFIQRYVTSNPAKLIK